MVQNAERRKRTGTHAGLPIRALHDHDARHMRSAVATVVAAVLATAAAQGRAAPEAVPAVPVVASPAPAAGAPITETTGALGASSTPSAEVVPAGPVQLVAVLDLKPTGEGAVSAAAALTTMLTAEVAAQAGYKAISRNEIKSILSHQADAQLAGCNEPQCAADVAQLVNADVLVTGQVDKVGGATVVSLSLIDASSKGENGEDLGPAVIGRQELAFRGPDDAVLLVVRPLVQRLFDGAAAHTHVGSLEVFTEDGATVIVDGKELGASPVSAAREVPTGVHTVTVTKDGRVTSTLDVVISRNETTITRVDLAEESLYEQPWFWGVVGGSVLVVGGAAAGLATYALAQDQPTRVTLGKPVE